jgi:hypothetical protein
MLTSSTFNTLMYSKTSSYEAPRPQLVLDSTIEIFDRESDRTETVLNATKGNRAEQLLCDHATLLLSIADIAQSEIQQCPSALLEDDSKDSLIAPHHHRRITPSSLPTFPKQLESGNACAIGSKPNLLLLPRNDSLRHSILLGNSSQRHRSVSFDSPTSVLKNIIHPWESTTPSSTSPLSVPRSPKNCRTPRLFDEPEKVTTKRSNKSHYSLYQSSPKKARLEPSPRATSSVHRCRTKKLLPQVSALLSPRITLSSQSSANSTTVVAGATKQQALQGTPPEGMTIRKVYRRKFSWKNYPQVRCFSGTTLYKIDKCCI